MTKHYNFKSPKGYYSFSGIIVIKCLRFTIYESLNKSILIKQKTIGSQACHCTRLRPAPCLCVRKHSLQHPQAYIPLRTKYALLCNVLHTLCGVAPPQNGYFVQCYAVKISFISISRYYVHHFRSQSPTLTPHAPPPPACGVRLFGVRFQPPPTNPLKGALFYYVLQPYHIMVMALPASGQIFHILIYPPACAGGFFLT